MCWGDKEGDRKRKSKRKSMKEKAEQEPQSFEKAVNYKPACAEKP